MADFFPPEVRVDGLKVNDGRAELWGVATRQPNGRYACYANVAGMMCVVEVRLYETAAASASSRKAEESERANG